MLTIVIALLLCAGIAAFVVALVLIPARREGRDVLTSRGEDLVASIRETSGNVVDKVTPGRSAEDGVDAADIEDAPTSRPATGA